MTVDRILTSDHFKILTNAASQYKLILLYIILDSMDISNQGPTDLIIRELSPMEVQFCPQGETN